MSGTQVTAEPTYRQANINDAEEISAVIGVVVKEPNPVAFDGPLTPEQVRTWLSRLGGEGGVFLAIVDGRVVGFSALDYNTFEPETVVLGVWMLGEVRRRGTRGTWGNFGVPPAQLPLDPLDDRVNLRVGELISHVWIPGSE